MRSPIILIRLFVPDPPSSTNLDDKAWLLTSFIQVPDQTVLGFGVAGATKDESLGRLFSELEPDEDGKFTVELGAILLQPLPNLNGQVDYTLEVPTEAGPLQICFSNQLTRLRYKIDDVYGHALCPRYKLEDILSETFEHVPQQAHVEYLPTVATCRFSIAGQDAEDALEGNIEDCINRFVTAINESMSAHLMLSTDESPILTPTYDRFSFDYFYLLIQGRDPSKIDGQRISPNVFRAALAARDYDEEESERFLAYVNGAIPIDDVPRILRAAKGYLDSGLNEFALLQLAIAAEIATSRAVRQLLRFAGVSQGKLDEMDRDMTFSRMLNVDVMALSPPGMKPDPNLIGSINRIRTLRNTTMHEAQSSVSQDELRRLYGQTDEYVRFLDGVLQYRGLK